MQPTTDADEQAIIQHWDCVAKSIDRVFASSCGTEIEFCEDEEREFKADQSSVVTIISFVGDVDWSVFSVYPKETAEPLATAFAGFKISYDSMDIADALGEIANIVAGKIQIELSERGTNIEISLPTVIRGSNLELFILQGVSSWKESYDCDHGGFWAGVFAGNHSRVTNRLR